MAITIQLVFKRIEAVPTIGAQQSTIPNCEFKVIHSEAYQRWDDDLVTELRSLSIQVPSTYNVRVERCVYHETLASWGELSFTIPGGSRRCRTERLQEIVSTFFDNRIVFVNDRTNRFRILSEKYCGKKNGTAILSEDVGDCRYLVE